MDISSQQNLFDAFISIAIKNPKSTAYAFQTNERIAKRSYDEVLKRVHAIINHLLECGCNNKSTVAIASNTRPEWNEADIAIFGAEGVVVSLYPSLTLKDVAYILSDAHVTIAFGENQEQVEKLLAASELNHRALTIISFEPTSFPQIPSITQIFEKYSTYNNSRSPRLTRNDLASIVYTSGTTGIPKGVMQTHGNHLSNLEQACESGVFGKNQRGFLYLPLAHSFARLVGYIGLLTPGEMIYPRIQDTKTSKLNLSKIAEDLRTSGAHFIPTVPRLFEKMQHAIESRSQQKGIQHWILKKTLMISDSVYRKKESKTPLTLREMIIFNATQPVREKLKLSLLGQNFTHAISGGAPLSVEVARFFAALGIDILQGYGLTETCVATNVNLPHKNRIGTVGPLFKHIEIKICSDSEVAFRGPNIAIGYWNKPEETKSSWDAEGWFYTGDLGSIDEEGFLTITGRKKELIVTAGGKKIAPYPIEEKLKSPHFVSQVIVIGDGKPYCVALFTIEQKIEKVEEILQEVVEKTNNNLASFEQIKKFAVLHEDFSIENGLLTPTLKMRRKSIEEKYREVIDKLY